MGWLVGSCACWLHASSMQAGLSDNEEVIITPLVSARCLRAVPGARSGAAGPLTSHGPGHGGGVVAVVHEALGNVLGLDAGGIGDGPA